MTNAVPPRKGPRPGSELPPRLTPLEIPPCWPEATPASSSGWPDTGTPPRITVVTPSYNQSAFLETTIRSVLEQGYPNLDYHVIDGGSTDDSAAILKHYEPWLSSWVSEPDRGQVDAILKGLAVADGEWFNWINSDDLLAPGALWEVAHAADSDLFAGCTQNFRGDALEHRRISRAINERDLVRAPINRRSVWHQPGIWFRTGALRQVGIDPSLHYRFDFDLLIRYVRMFPRVRYSGKTLAWFRKHADSKTVSQKERFDLENQLILHRLLEDPGAVDIRADVEEALACLEWQRKVKPTTENTSAPRLARLLAVIQETNRTPKAWRWGASYEALGKVLNPRQRLR